MARIPVTQGLYALIDDEDLVTVGRYRWHTCRNGRTCYARRNGSASERRQGLAAVYLHHAILGVVAEVDHINGDGLDNRRENLRIGTHQQNISNQRKQLDTSSRFKGVDYYKQYGRWRARCKCNGHVHCLGYFEHEEDAARAYDAAARSLFGAYARTNFPAGPLGAA